MSAQSEIIVKYGLPGAAYQSRYCTIWQIDADFPWFPAKRMLINIDFKHRWQVALSNIFEADLQHEIITFDGCYSDRKVRGRSAISLHSWAMAWDMNAHTETLGQTSTRWSEKFLALVKAAGIFWGGGWKRPDPMHFALFNG